MANVGNEVHSLSYLYFDRLSTVINTSTILSQAWANLCRVSYQLCSTVLWNAISVSEEQKTLHAYVRGCVIVQSSLTVNVLVYLELNERWNALTFILCNWILFYLIGVTVLGATVLHIAWWLRMLFKFSDWPLLLFIPHLRIAVLYKPITVCNLGSNG